MAIAAALQTRVPRDAAAFAALDLGTNNCRLLIEAPTGDAELEAGLISQRTRAALAIPKVRGVRLGNPSTTPATAEMAAAPGRRAAAR